MVLSDAQRHAIACGQFKNLPQLMSKVVRVFISSTFTDTQCERNYLMEYVYPKLRQECQEKYGLSFQVVDMRWGISDTSQDDHGTSDLCLKEIEICTRLSFGPSFMCLLGQRYGFRPLPTKLPVHHFKAVRDALNASGADLSLLEKWYLLDENNAPPVYHLRPISSVFPGFTNGGQERRTILSEHWYPESAALFRLLEEGVSLCLQKHKLKHAECEEYFISVTEQEIRAGIFKHPSVNHSVVCSIRHVENKDAICTHDLAKYYTDLDQDGNPDKQAQELLEKLKTDTLPSKLSPLNFIYCGARFIGDNGIDETTHAKYLNDLGEKVQSSFFRLIELDLEHTGKIRDDPQLDEIIQHSSLCERRCEVFRGRLNLLKDMKQKLSSRKLQKKASVLHSERQPIVVFGESGSGKTSLMAKCASQMHEWTQKWARPVVIVRFLGTTPLSCDIRPVVESVCRQICAAYREDFQEQKDYDSLMTYFNTLLKLGSEQSPLYIFLDSIDQLSSSNHPYRLLWLPRVLPPNCYIVLSFLPHKFNLLENAQQVITSNMQYMEVTSLESSVCFEVLQDWLKIRKRTNTKEQNQIIKAAFQQCSLPLYVRFVFDAVSKWTSHMPLEECKLENSVQGCIEALFDRLEMKHGRILVSHTLGYLTASKTGLSDGEMNDLLSLDDEVLNEVFTHWLPPIRRIPSVLWSRICNDLEMYVVEREADGLSVSFWYHRQFIEVAKRRYLTDEKLKVYLYSIMADYYRGVWANGKKKPFVYSKNQIHKFSIEDPNSEADRFVPEMPLSFKNGDNVFYNMRKLNHLPRLLALSQNYEALKEEVLFNYEWLFNKLCATSVQAVIYDYSRAADIRPEVKSIIGALSMAGTSLNRNPKCLSVELLGRLMTKAITESKDSIFANFLADVMTKGEAQCALQPLHLSFDVPKVYQLFSLEGHRENVIGMQFSPKGDSFFSISIDGTIANWDLRSGERISLITVGDLELDNRTLLRFSVDGEFLICDTRTEYSPLLVFSPTTGQCLHELGERLNPPYTNTAESKRFVCRNGTMYDIALGNELGSLDGVISKREWAKIFLDSKERYILASSGNNVLVIDILTLYVKGKLYGENKPSAIIARDDVCVVGYISDTVVKIFSIEEGPHFGKCLHTVNYAEYIQGPVFEPKSFYRKEVADVDVSNNGRLFLANIQRCYLLVFDVDLTTVSIMKDHEKHYGDDPSYFWASFSSDDKMVISVSQKRFLVLWDSATGDNLACTEIYNGLFDIRYLIPSPCANIAATFAVSDYAIKIWDLDKLRADASADYNETLIRYDNPMTSECIRARGEFIFVKHFMPLVVERSFKFISHFGLDAVHMPSGKKTVLLPFDRYGVPVDFDVSHNLKFLTFAVTIDEVQVLYLVGLKYGQLLWDVVLGEEAVEVRFSSRDSYIIVGNQDSIAVFDRVSSEKAMEAEKVVCCEMDPSETFLIGIQSVHSSMKAKLVRVTGEEFLTLNCDFSARSIKFFPNHSDQILATEIVDQACVVYIYDLAKEETLRKIDDIIGGIADVASNGVCFVDYGLNIIYLDGFLRKSCYKEKQIQSPVVQITATGKYVYWLDENRLSIKCVEVYTSKEVAICDLHSRPVGLALFGKGYQVCVGCKDGRLVFLALHKGRKSNTLSKILTAAGRPIEWLKGKVFEPTITACSEECLESLKAKFKVNRKPKLTLNLRRRSRRRRSSNSSDSENVKASGSLRKNTSFGGYSSGSDSDSGSDRSLLRSSAPITSSLNGSSMAQGSSTCCLLL